MEKEEILRLYGQRVFDLLIVYNAPENKGAWEQIFIEAELEKHGITLEPDDVDDNGKQLYAFYDYYEVQVMTV